MSFNKVIEIGNLVADPELKKTPSGIAVTTFRIAVARRFAKEGDVQADFFDVVCWKEKAEFVTRFFTKGMPILICGALQSRNWTDNNNQKRYAVEIVADEVSFVERKGSGTTAQPQDAQESAEPNFEEVDTEDSLPF